MRNRQLYEYISKRKSVRKYEMKPLSEETCRGIEAQMEDIIPLMESLQVEMKLLPQEGVKGLLAIKAPHYLLFFSEQGKGYLENAGFMMQQMDLYLSAGGLGSCWLGMAKPTSGFQGVSDKHFVIAMALGVPAEEVHRDGPAHFKRKLKEEICTTPYHNELVEAARLAPSATNSQPWRFKTEPNVIHAYRATHNLLKAWLYDRLNSIDMGIALYHLALAAEEKGYGVRFYRDENAAEDHPLSTQYTLSMGLVKQG